VNSRSSVVEGRGTGNGGVESDIDCSVLQAHVTDVLVFTDNRTDSQETYCIGDVLTSLRARISARARNTRIHNIIRMHKCGACSFIILYSTYVVAATLLAQHYAYYLM